MGYTPPVMPPVYEAVIGLEAHVQLATASKLFCRCPHRFGAPPNALVCPICLGYPGTLPTLNRAAVDRAVTLALALGAEVAPESAFDRKSYFYPDLPKGYQITQERRPLATGGHLPLTRHEGTFDLVRLHLEEDSGRLIHGDDVTLVDFNRAGVPLAEVVTEPRAATPAEARDFAKSLHRLALWTGAAAAGPEEGGLRIDANVSLRPAGGDGLGTRTEIKNLNSFRHLARALEHEIERQQQRLAAGGEVELETRGFDEAEGVTRPLRDKEGGAGYRFFPEPDLPPLTLAAERVAGLAAALPEPPWRRRERLAGDYRLSEEHARALAADRELVDYFEAAAARHPERPARVAHWVLGALLHELREREAPLAAAPPPEHLGELAALVDGGRVSRAAARRVLDELFERGGAPAEAVERLGLERIDDTDEIAGWAEAVLAEHPSEAERLRGGEERLLDFFIGRVMERSRGRAEPARVRRVLEEALAEPATVRS